MSEVAAIIGLAVDAVLLAALNQWMKRLNKSADEIERAPHYKPGPELVDVVKGSEMGYIAYASLEGEVMPVGQVLTSQHSEGKAGVMKEISLVEHKSQRIQGVWTDVKKSIQDKVECVPFYLRRWMGKGADTEVHVQEPSEAGFILGDLTTTYDHFTPNNAGLWSRGVDRLFGESTKGLHETERMLLTNTVILGIGEIALVDNELQLRPPKSGARYILTTMSKAEVIKRLKNRSFWVKMFTLMTGAIGAAIVLHLVKKYYRKWKRGQEQDRFLAEMREIREQRENGDSSAVDNTCVVCLTNPREIVLLNCGHICLCAECLSVMPQPLKCPVCRQDVERYVSTYNP